MTERRFPTVANRVSYWHVHDIEFANPSTALEMVNEHVHELILMLK